MKPPNIESFEDMVPCIEKHLLPQIHQAVEVSIECFYVDDVFNDMWTFGTQLWRNTWNRLKTAAEDNDCPFELFGKGNEYKLKLGPYVIRHHRINSQSGLPTGAKAVKSAANDQIQMPLFGDEWGAPTQKDNIIIAIDANVQDGLKEVFIGEILPLELDSKKYKWVQKSLVFLAEGAEPSTAEIVHIPDMSGSKYHIPEEEIQEVPVDLDQSKVNPKNIEGEGDK